MVYKKNLPPQLQNYEMVEDRLVRFWKHCPNGRLKTEVVEIFDNGDLLFGKMYFLIPFRNRANNRKMVGNERGGSGQAGKST
jgi:hypothetical protein